MKYLSSRKNHINCGNMLLGSLDVTDYEYLLSEPSNLCCAISNLTKRLKKNWNLSSVNVAIAGTGIYQLACNNHSQMGRPRWQTHFALDTGGSSNTEGQDNVDGDNGGLGRTRLGIIVRAAARQLLEKLNAARKNVPMKIFLLLLGFYTANALATILGQTGDWDVLVAGVVVAAIEGIGMLMYVKPFTKPVGRFQSLVVMVNYWKAGVCLGLFVDAFKLGS